MAAAVRGRGGCQTSRPQKYLWSCLLGCTLFVLALAVVGCAKPVPREQALANLKAQADEVGQAISGPNHERMADLTHPGLIKGIGGRAAYIDKLKAAWADLGAKGFRFGSIVMAEPNQPVDADGELYAVVPYALELVGPNDIKGKMNSFLLGHSTDGGRTWTFLDGAGATSDPQALKTVLPKLPSSLPLPKNQPATWG